MNLSLVKKNKKKNEERGKLKDVIPLCKHVIRFLRSG